MHHRQPVRPHRQGGYRRRCSLRLPGCSQESPGVAREHVRRTLLQWGVPGEQRNALEIIVTELAANAVTHTVSQVIIVVISLRCHSATVKVVDRGPRRPLRARAADWAEENGRGLWMVEAIADRWGHQPAGPGTTVSFSR